VRAWRREQQSGKGVAPIGSVVGRGKCVLGAERRRENNAKNNAKREQAWTETAKRTVWSCHRVDRGGSLRAVESGPSSWRGVEGLACFSLGRELTAAPEKCGSEAGVSGEAAHQSII